MISQRFLLINILVASFILRVIAIKFFGDQSIPNEWKQLIFNIENYQTFGIKSYNNEVIPTILVPPLYPLFLYSVKMISSDSLFIISVLGLQAVFSILAIYYIYIILKIFYSENISLIAALIFSLVPINIYSVTQISSISLQVFLSTLFLFYFEKCLSQKKNVYVLVFGFICGLLILLRGEFLIFFFLSVFYYYFKKRQLKKVLYIFIITLLVISPYLTRNYKTFGTLTITKSFGFNLWRGNNEFSTVEGGFSGGWSDVISKKMKNEMITKDNYKEPETFGEYVNNDIFIDNSYRDLAIQNIKDNPIKYISFYFKKLFSFVTYDLNSTYPNYFNLLHIIPKFLFSFSTIISIIILYKKKNYFNFVSLLYIVNILVISAFFILPRYSISLLPFQIIISAVLIKKLKPNI